METPKVEVLISRATSEISLVSIGDDGTEHETTLSLEEAWAAVASLNESIQKLIPGFKTVPKKEEPMVQVTINVTGTTDPDAIAKAVHKAMSSYASHMVNATQKAMEDSKSRKPRVREAVLNSIGADQVRSRHAPPGEPRTIPVSGLRETELV